MDFDKLYLDGGYTAPLSEAYIEVEDPADLSIIARVPRSGPEDVDRAIESAVRGYHIWQNTDPAERREAVAAMVEYLVGAYPEIAPILARELGCTERFALKGHLEIYTPAMRGFLADHEALSTVEHRDGYDVYLRPLGVVAALTPWNYPFGQIVRKVIPALLAGNSVILKPSKSAPLTAYFWAEAASAANLPAGVFTLLPGKGSEVGNLLAKDPRVDAISFTGSTDGGKEVGALGLTSTTKRILLEMGGKSPGLFLPGIDEEKKRKYAKSLLDTLYLNVGQTCSAHSRMLVPAAEKESYERILKDLTDEYTFGNPKDPDTRVGVLNGKDQFEKVRRYVKLGIEEGAKVLLGEVPTFNGRDYAVDPVIFTDVDNQMTIARDEIFGPVLCLIPYDDVDDAVQIANDTIYGLSAMVFGPDDEEALAAAAKIRAGQVIVGDGTRSQNAPFGGFKESGIGREGAEEGLREFYEIQTIFYPKKQ